MKKIINNVIFYTFFIFLSLFLTLSSFNLLFGADQGGKYVEFNPNIQNIQPASNPPPWNAIVDSVLNAFVSQGITGCMLIVIGFYLYRTENQARDDRNDLTRKLEDLVIRSQDNLVEVKSEVSGMKGEMSGIKIELGNYGREIESIRNLLMTKS